MEKVLRVLEEEYQGPLCQCAARTCGPHRCRASRGYRAAFLVLLLLFVVEMSFRITELDDRWGKKQQQWQTALQAQVLAEVDYRILKLYDALDARDRAAQQALQADLDKVHALLRRVEGLQWVVATPELERDLQLKAALEALRP